MKAIKRLKLPHTILLIMVFMGACGPIVDLGGDPDTAELFTLTNTVETTEHRLSIPTKIFIEDPSSEALLSTTHIAVRLGKAEVKYLPLARWTDKPESLVRERMQIALEAVEGLTPLGATALEVPTDYRLKLQLRAFNAKESGNGQLSADIQIAALLVSARGSEVLDTKRFKAQRIIPTMQANDIVSALNEAHNEVLEDIRTWIVQNISTEN